MYFRVKVKLRKKLFGHFFDQLKEKYKNLQTFLIGVPLLVKKKSVITCTTETTCCFPYLYLHRVDLNSKSLLHFFTLTPNDMKTTSATKAVGSNAFLGSM